MAECVCLENRSPFTRTVGSNPTSSDLKKHAKACFFLVERGRSRTHGGVREERSDEELASLRSRGDKARRAEGRHARVHPADFETKARNSSAFVVSEEVGVATTVLVSCRLQSK